MTMMQKMIEYGYAQKFVLKKDGAQPIRFGNALQAMVVAGIVTEDDDPEILGAVENGDTVEITVTPNTHLRLSWGRDDTQEW